MSTTTLFTIGIVVLVGLIVFWFVRSRGNTSGHIDTTMTGLGAATEAVEDIVESVTHSFEGTHSEEATPTSPEPAAAPARKPDAAQKPAAAAVKKSAAAKEPAPAKKPAAAKKPVAKAPKAAPETAAKSPAGKAKMTAIGVPAAVGEPDDLRQIKGVGPKLNSLLTELGITRFDQIAAWGPKEIETVDAHLGTFKGRIARDNWVEQAGYLAKGDTAGFEAKFGALNG